jgi:elongation factor Tu
VASCKPPHERELNKAIALQARSRFAIREGNRTVGAGIVTAIVE